MTFMKRDIINKNNSKVICDLKFKMRERKNLSLHISDEDKGKMK
jgi:5-methylcytosine-specific restriction endonuclease McrBC regulatory subunit McrC